MMKKLLLLTLPLMMIACAQKTQQQEEPQSFTGAAGEVKLITLDPGHFHAALVQKTSYPQISEDVYVYSPGGEDLKEHLAKVEAYNQRAENPTHWNEVIYTGEDFMEKMIAEKKGNVMVTAGNNRLKTDYIKQTLEAGINVLADKPMVITPDKFDELKECFDIAAEKGILLYDIMTERHEITTILQRELSRIADVYGTQESGTPENPGVVMESVHNFYKVVSGKALTRPAWFYDIKQQGEGLVDVSTHLVDLVQWECFPDVVLDYTKDIQMNGARRWPTVLTKEQFKASTGLDEFPEFLQADVKDGKLNVYQNGEINYCLKGVNAKLTILWDFEAPTGGDSHYSNLRGTKAELTIKQGKEENFRPELYIFPTKETAKNLKAYGEVLAKNFTELEKKYPNIDLEKTKDGKGWHVIIPDFYRNGHEAHFGQVTENFLKYLVDGKLPEWEVPNMIAKYYVTTQALKMALEK